MRLGRTILALVLGDITEQTTDAIVNAANASLRGGGGVDGAIHRAGGSTIDKECLDYVRRNGPLVSGAAMWTHGGNLAARFVIHTVGPIYRSERESAPILRNAYGACLELAGRLGIRSLSFPSISTGAYGYPVETAASVAIDTLVSNLRAGSDLALVRCVAFTPDVHEASIRALREHEGAR